MNYKEAVMEFGSEIAAALLEEEYNQFIRGIEPTPAPSYSFDDVQNIKDNYIDYIENIGYRKVTIFNHDEELYRMEEEF